MLAELSSLMAGCRYIANLSSQNNIDQTCNPVRNQANIDEKQIEKNPANVSMQLQLQVQAQTQLQRKATPIFVREVFAK